MQGLGWDVFLLRSVRINTHKHTVTLDAPWQTTMLMCNTSQEVQAPHLLLSPALLHCCHANTSSLVLRLFMSLVLSRSLAHIFYSHLYTVFLTHLMNFLSSLFTFIYYSGCSSWDRLQSQSQNTPWSVRWLRGWLDGLIDGLITKVGYTWVPLSPFHPCPCALQGKHVHINFMGCG